MRYFRAIRRNWIMVAIAASAAAAVGSYLLFRDNAPALNHPGKEVNNKFSVDELPVGSEEWVTWFKALSPEDKARLIAAWGKILYESPANKADWRKLKVSTRTIVKDQFNAQKPHAPDRHKSGNTNGQEGGK